MRQDGYGSGLRHLAWPGQLLAGSMIVFPLSAVLLSVLVPGAGGALGRAQGVGLLVESLLGPLVGVFLGVYLAETFGQRALRRCYALFCGVSGLGVLSLAPLFVLDSLAVRGGVQAARQQLFDLNILRAVLILLAVGSILVLLAVAILRALERERAAAPAPARRPALAGSPAATPVRG